MKGENLEKRIIELEKEIERRDDAGLITFRQQEELKNIYKKMN